MTGPQIVLAVALAIVVASILGVVRAADPDLDLPDAEPLDWTGDKRRKRDAKRANEQLKLASTLLNNFGIALVIAVFIAPAARNEEAPGYPVVILALITIGLLHIFAQLILRFWRSEE